MREATSLSSSETESAHSTTMSGKGKRSFRYWQWRILLSLIFGYAAFYFVRLNFSFAMPALEAEFGYSNTKLGGILTAFAIIYGVGKAISGTFSDRSNARYFMPIGLFLSACACFLMGFSTSFLCLLVFWALNACFQSMGAPPCQRLLTHWFHPKELATKWAIWNVSHQIGALGITVLAGQFLIENYGWRSAFWVPAVLTVGASFILLKGLRDTPESLGLPSIEHHTALRRGEPLPTDIYDEDLSLREIFMDKVIKNRLVWYMCWATLFFSILRFGLINWAPTFLIKSKGSSLVQATWQIVGFEISAMCGGIIAGYLSDKVFQGRRGPVAFIFMICLAGLLLYLWRIPQGSDFLNAFVMFIIGFFVSGPQILQGVAAADFASKKAAGAANGLTGTFGYLGGAFSGIGIGKVVDVWGWNAAFIIFAISALISAFFFALTWNHSAQNQSSKK